VIFRTLRRPPLRRADALPRRTRPRRPPAGGSGRRVVPGLGPEEHADEGAHHDHAHEHGASSPVPGRGRSGALRTALGRRPSFTANRSDRPAADVPCRRVARYLDRVAGAHGRRRRRCSHGHGQLAGRHWLIVETAYVAIVGLVAGTISDIKRSRTVGFDRRGALRPPFRTERAPVKAVIASPRRSQPAEQPSRCSDQRAGAKEGRNGPGHAADGGRSDVRTGYGRSHSRTRCIVACRTWVAMGPSSVRVGGGFCRASRSTWASPSSPTTRHASMSREMSMP